MTAIPLRHALSPAPLEHGRPTGRMFRMEKIGIVFDQRLSLKSWEEIGRHLISTTDSVSWWIADWLAFGETQFKDRYKEAVKRTSLSYQTLRNYAWVARQIELSRRRDGLSFGHHAEVAALDHVEQDYWLRIAERDGWSRSRLRHEVRASRRERMLGLPDTGQAQNDGTDDDAMALNTFRLRLAPSEQARCEQAAASRQMPLDTWAAHVLITAAEQALTPDGR